MNFVYRIINSIGGGRLIKIGTILKNIRIENTPLTQRQLGDKIGVANNTISNYECNFTQPDFDTIIKILKICGNYQIKIVSQNGEEVDLEKYSIDPDV